MQKKILCIIFASLLLSKVIAKAEFTTDFFTGINNSNKFSYGLFNNLAIEFQTDKLRLYGDTSITNYRNLFIPFEHFDLSAPELNAFSYNFGTELKFNKIKTGLSFFGTELLDNSISVSIIDFRLKLKKTFGTNLSINMFNDFYFNFSFFNSSPEFQKNRNNASGNLKVLYTNGMYNLQTNKINIDFLTAFLYGYGTFDFYIPQANLIFLHEIFSGHGDFQMTAIATGASINTKNNTINFSANLGLIYLITTKLSVDTLQTSRILFITTEKNIPYKKDISGTLLIPFDFEIKFSTYLSNYHLQSSILKSFVIPISKSNNFDFKQLKKINESDYKSNSILRMILLSGINVYIKIDF